MTASDRGGNGNGNASVFGSGSNDAMAPSYSNPHNMTASSSSSSALSSDASIDDFDLLSLLGEGAFGKVLMVRHKRTARIFAMKIVRKAEVVRADKPRQVRWNSRAQRSSAYLCVSTFVPVFALCYLSLFLVISLCGTALCVCMCLCVCVFLVSSVKFKLCFSCSHGLHSCSPIDYTFLAAYLT